MSHIRSRPLALVGSRGSGKSTVGRLLAPLCALEFIDMDTRIEHLLGCSIADAFALRGELAFRDAESAVLADLVRQNPDAVIATGGGVIVRPANREILQSTTQVVWLQVPPRILAARLEQDPASRPSLTGKPISKEVEEILAIREPLYREVAHHIVDAARPPHVVATEIARIPLPIR